MSISEAARYLGVSEGTLKKHVTPVHLGARVLFDRIALDEFADGLKPGSSSADRVFGVE